RLALIAPAVVVRRINQGVTLSLGHDTGDWGLNAEVIYLIARVSRAAARQVIAQNARGLAAAISKLSNFELGELGDFIEVMEDFAPEEWRAILNSIDVPSARKNWVKLCTNTTAVPSSGTSELRGRARRSMLRLASSAMLSE